MPISQARNETMPLVSLMGTKHNDSDKMIVYTCRHLLCLFQVMNDTRSYENKRLKTMYVKKNLTFCLSNLIVLMWTLRLLQYGRFCCDDKCQQIGHMT